MDQAIEDRLKKRIRQLINRAEVLKSENPAHSAKRRAWLAAAFHVLNMITPKGSAYDEAISIQNAHYREGWSTADIVDVLSEYLSVMMEDIDNGILASIIYRAKGETYDDFLEHAKAYMNDGKARESGVIAGVVFEDTIRQICSKNGIDEKGQKLDALITQLQQRTILTIVKAKRARASADVRTKATHAQWDQFDLGDVKSTIDFTENLIADYLDR